MSDVEVAAAVARRIDEALAGLGAAGPDAEARLASVAARLPEDMAVKAEFLLAADARLRADPGFRLPDPESFDRIAAEVLAALDGLVPAAPPPAESGLPPNLLLPRLRAEPRRQRQPVEGGFPLRGASGWRMAALVAAVLASMAASIWL